MKDLMLMLASVMPFESIVEMLEKEIAEYKANPCSDTESKLCSVAVLLLSKDAIKIKGGVENLIKETDRIKSGYDLLTPKEG